MRMLRFSLALLLPILFFGMSQNAGALWFGHHRPWETIVVGTQSEPERLATIDLQRYLGQVTLKVPRILAIGQWQTHPSPAVIVGTPGGNALIQNLRLDPAAVGEDGYALAEQKLGRSEVVLAGGLTPAGAVNAVYGLLKELGYGFYLGSEAVPSRLPDALAGRIVRKPALKIRGVLPWYNFFNSPTAWDPIDHRAFVDQLIRSGANFVGFHTYENEPFGADEDNGTMKWGHRLLSTATSTWGTHPLPSAEFAFGTNLLYPDKYFGAATTLAIADDNAAIHAEQDVLRDALEYARRRGLHACIGFEAIGNPTSPADRDVFLRRLNHLLDQYPAVDYLWIWQSEVVGAQGTMPTGDEDPLIPYGIAWRDTFKRVVERHAGARPFFQDNEVGKVAREMEGARLAQFALLAHHALAHRAGAPRLVVSGWGGDERLLSAEYYEGLDKLLPKDVVFASLDNIPPRKRIDTIYHELPKDRERWPIVWMEGDGDEWHPQPSIYQYYEDCAKDVQKSGCQGLLTIHWRTREIEENFAYWMEAAWHPNLPADTFFTDLAGRCYGPELGPELAAIHSELDKLQYRWVSGVGQSECSEFQWGPGTEEKARQLEALRGRAAGVLARANRAKNTQAAARLTWLIHRMDWVLNFRDTELAAVQARELIAQARAANSPEQSQALAKQALALLDRGDLAKALQSYAQLLSTRGEYGVLATINTKAVYAWRDLRGQAKDLLALKEKGEPNSRWDPNPAILLPRFLGSAVEFQTLELEPIVLGGQPAWLHYRTLGQRKWTNLPLQNERGWVFKAQIPNTAMTAPGVQYGFSFSRNPKDPMELGPRVVTVLPQADAAMRPGALLAPAADLRLTAQVREGHRLPLDLTWNDLAQADYYKVTCDGKLMVETAAPVFPDAPPKARGSYTVEAWRGGHAIARTEAIPYSVPDQPASETFTLTLHPSQAGVLLRWPAAASPLTVAYEVRRARSERELGDAEVLARIPASRIGDHVSFDRPGRGEWVYEVRPVSAAGKVGPGSRASVRFAPQKSVTPAIDLPLNVAPAGADVKGQVTFNSYGAHIADGSISLPNQEAMNLGNGLSVAFEFKADDLQGMPVILSHGFSMGDGWFVQIMGQRLTVQTAFGSVEGPVLATGQWYRALYVFNGVKARLAVNGEWTGEAVKVRPVPADKPLMIGQYTEPAPQYTFHGHVRNVRIYDDVLRDVQ